ncbi:MAG: hypothetical protein FJ404_07750 [Verrucomicrobia bacterium]|nr:hypothetical protein [Verrucomicrobiota bacterium]
MKKLFPRSLLVLLFSLGLATFSLANDLDRLNGTWKTERKSPDGEVAKLTLEIKAGKFKFRMQDADGSLRLYAEGSVKIEKQGVFQALRFGDIKGGVNENELSEVNDDRLNLYQLGYDSLTMASNFDRERDEAPRMDVYKKVTEPKAEKK